LSAERRAAPKGMIHLRYFSSPIHLAYQLPISNSVEMAMIRRSHALGEAFGRPQRHLVLKSYQQVGG
jgi:hypothetical protein